MATEEHRFKKLTNNIRKTIQEQKEKFNKQKHKKNQAKILELKNKMTKPNSTTH